MRRFAPLGAADRVAGRWRNALRDPARRERNVLLALAAYVLIWTVYAVISKSSQGLHDDMTELIAWSRDLQLGYLKHPPLAAYLVWIWFSVFPVAEWSYYLLAMLTPALALWIVWRLSADYLDIEKRIAGLALLTLVPFFNFHALKFNVNTVLIPLWAATTLFFLRSYTTRSTLYAALAGLCAAACMLGKYWSVFLLAGLAVAALIDRRRGVYFRSAAPWITVLVGLVVLGPHLAWLVRHDFAPLSYAMSVHGEKPFVTTAVDAFGYLAGSLGYVAVPVIIVLVAARPSRATIADMLWPADGERRLVAAAFWAPLLLPFVAALASGTAIGSLWSMPAFALLPVLLLSPPALTLRPVDVRRVLGLTAALPLVMLIVSPAIAIAVHRKGAHLPAAQSELLAAQVERAWHGLSKEPLRYVGGDAGIAYGVIAYAGDRPRALPGLPQPSRAELAHRGVALVCFAEDAGCRWNADAQAAQVGPSLGSEIEITRKFLGLPGRAQRYAIVIVPPREPVRTAGRHLLARLFDQYR
jgi:Dolichyl-phosphate-mannose-protein mannosyltransferase